MKKTALLVFCASPLWAAPIVTPSTATVFVGGNTIQFTSTNTITWSLASGSTGTISAGGLYTSPSTGTFHPKQVMSGCMLRPNDDIFNTRIDALPVDANSNTRILNMTGGTTQYFTFFDNDDPENVYSSNTPTTNFTFSGTNNLNGPFPLLPFPYEDVENTAISNNQLDGRDYHYLGVSTTTCQFSEIYDIFPTGDFGCPTCNAGSGLFYYGNQYALPDDNSGNGGGTNAAGIPLEATTIHYAELKALSINHALAFTLSNSHIPSAFIWPATSHANPGCTPSANCVPYGARWRLKSSFNISSYSPEAQAILKAMQQYGAVMIDGGLGDHVTTNKSVRMDTMTWQVVHNELRNVFSNFDGDFVDESSLMVSTFTSQVNLSNPYVTPDNYAEVIASDTVNHTTATIRIALQPVSVGTYNIPFPGNVGALSVMAGTPQFLIQTWVEGSTNQVVTCTMSPTIGTLTSGCLYTAPTTQTLWSSATLTITPQADTTQTFTEPLVIYPSDGIRINTGGKSAANSPAPPYDAAGNYGPDANGKYWWTDPIGLSNAINQNDEVSPQSSWPNSTDVGLYYTDSIVLRDMCYGLMVPNGNYTLTLGFGDNAASNVANSTVTIDSQGVYLSSAQPTLTATFTPTTTSYTINVPNNQFYFCERDINSAGVPMVSNWSLIPVAVSPPTKTITGNAQWKGNFTIQ